MLFNRMLSNQIFRNVNNISTPTAYETGWTLPTIGQNNSTGVAWTNPNNITTLSTASVATIAFLNVASSQYLFGKTFDFSSISDLATIDGIAVRINMKASIPDSVDAFVKLFIAGSAAGTNLGTNTLLASTYTVRTYGNSTAKWGNTLTPAIVKATTFGTGIIIDNPNDTYDDISVASIEMNIYYTV